MSYDRRAKTITVDSLKPWKQDLRRMTQIYKSIAEASDEKRMEVFEEARMLFLQFKKSFERWVYREVLPTTQRDKQSPMEREVATKAWDAVINLSGGELFPYDWDYKTQKDGPAPWKAIERMKTNILRYQRKMNDALKSIESYIVMWGGQLERRPEFEKYHIGGVDVVIHSAGRDLDKGEYQEEYIHNELSTLKKAVQKMAAAGFSAATKGLTVHLKFDRSDLRGGQYDRGADELTLFPLGIGREDNSTLIHECGHRYYYRAMPSQARAYWEEVIDNRAILITSEDVERFQKKYVLPYYQKHERTPGPLDLRAEVKNIPDEAERAKMRHLVEGIPVFTNDPNEFLDFMLKNRVNERVDLEFISEYGATNAAEAFAEAFMLWVTKGPRAVGPWTRDFFVKLTRTGSGGARYAYKR